MLVYVPHLYTHSLQRRAYQFAPVTLLGPAFAAHEGDHQAFVQGGLKARDTLLVERGFAQLHIIYFLTAVICGVFRPAAERIAMNT